MKLFSIILWICLLPVLSFSQNNGSITGQLRNNIDGRISQIEIRLVELNIHTHSDKNGHFEFKNLPRQSYYVYAVYDGFTFDPVQVDLTKKKQQDIQVFVGLGETLGEIQIKAKTRQEILKNNAIKANIISVEEQSHRANSVEDLVNHSPGVKMRNVGGMGSASNIIVGGFTGNAVKFLYDNIPIDYLGSNYGLTKTPTNNIGRIEVYKGVLPTKIGVDALGGAINIIPKKRNKTSGTISYETGSFNTHIATINANIKLLEHLFIGTNSFYNYSKNNYKVDHLPYQNPETGQTSYIRERLFHNSFEQRSFEFFVEGRDLSWADLITFKVNSYDLEKDIQNDPYSRARPFGEAYRRERGNFIPSLKYKNYFIDNRLSLTQFLVYSHIDYELFDKAKNKYYDWKGQVHQTHASSEMGNFLLEDGYLNNEFNQLTSRTYLNFLINDNLQLENNTVYSHYNQKSNIDKLNPEGTKYSKLITGLSLNGRWVDQRLETNTQFKYLYGQLAGHYEASDNPLESVTAKKEVQNLGFSFSQAAKWKFNQLNYIRVSYENTYRLPDQNELFGDNNFIVANYDLVSEKSNNFNFGFTHTGDKFSYEINTYYRNTKNLIRLKNLNQYQAKYLNLDNVSGFGLELEAGYEPLQDLMLTGNLTWNDFRLKSSQDPALNNQHFKHARIANMPFYYANLSASYNLKNLLNLSTNFSVFWDYSYVHQYYLDFIEKKFEPDGFLGLWGTSKINTSRVIPIQHLHNVGLVYVRDIGEQSVSFSIALKNVFDQEIYNEFKMQSPGRNFRVKITYSF